MLPGAALFVLRLMLKATAVTRLRSRVPSGYDGVVAGTEVG